MYGMVNRALREMTVAHFGQATWDAALTHAGADEVEFATMTVYPDAVTYTLLGSLSEVTGQEAGSLLHALGEYWIDFAATEGYAGLLELNGRSFYAFLEDLDEIHTRLQLAFPGSRPPTFKCSNHTSAGFLLHYTSIRPGLTRLVTGLVCGLARRFEVKVRVEIESLRSDDVPHDTLRVHYDN